MPHPGRSCLSWALQMRQPGKRFAPELELSLQPVPLHTRFSVLVSRGTAAHLDSNMGLPDPAAHPHGMGERFGSATSCRYPDTLHWATPLDLLC